MMLFSLVSAMVLWYKYLLLALIYAAAPISPDEFDP
jgi:hypothetical protein